MRPTILVALGLILAAGSGCAARDFENMCHASERAGVADVADPAERAMRTAQWLDKKLWSRDARRAFGALGAVRCEERGRILIQAAKEAGYTGPCPMAEESTRQCAESAAKLRAPEPAAPAAPAPPAAPR